MIKFLDLQKQYRSIKEEIDAAIFQVLESSSFIMGEHVERFEKNFAAYQETEHCVGVANGTDALEIAIESLDLQLGSEIIVPANTFIASAEAVTRSGHKVVFCDCGENYTILLDDLEKRITEKTSAIIAVHLYGHPCNMNGLLNIAKERNLRVIEDCAQAHGAEYLGTRVGGIGDVGTFSFYPGKNLGGYGDGGAILTNDSDISKKCRMISNHGRTTKYDHEFEGRNSRLDEIQASVLDVKLRHLDKWISNRRKIAELYSSEMKEISGVIVPKVEVWAKHAYHLYVIRCDERESLQKYLANKDISTGIHYPISLPQLTAYCHLDQQGENLEATRYSRSILSLPIGEHLRIADVTQICNAVRSFMQ